MDPADDCPALSCRASRISVVVRRRGVALLLALLPMVQPASLHARIVDSQPPAIAALRADQTRSAAELRDQALALRERADDRAARAWATLALAEFENDLENAEPALALLEKALRDADALALPDLRFAVLARQGIILVNRGRSAETDTILGLMKQMIDASDNRLWHAQWLHDRGVLERKLGRFDAARDYFGQARDVLKQLGDDAGVARELNSIGMLDGRTGRFSDAVVTHAEALKLARRAGDKGEIARSLRLLGVLYRNLDDEELASRYLGEALGYVEERNRREAISLHGDLAKSLSLLDRMDEADHHAEQAVTLAEISGSPPNRVNAFTRMAEIRLLQGRLDEAQRWADRAFESFDTVAIRDQVLLKLTRVQVRAARGETAAALREAEALLADTRRIGDRILERAALDLLSEQQLRAGDAANAFVTRKAHQALDKELAIDVAARRIAVLESSLDKERAESERELLERDNAIQSLTLNRQRLLGGLLLLGLLTLSIIAFLLHARYRSAEQSRRAISASRDELARLHQALIDSSAALERVAHTDALTGLANRHAMAKRLDESLTRTQGIVSVLILDLDHFKQVNDRYGHLAGDAVLREVAARLRASLPADAAIGRWGGEEFIAVLTGNSSALALTLAERVRLALAAAPVKYDGHSIAISASIGVASSPELNPASLDALLAAADCALYRVKRSGRNRVEAAVPI